MNSIGGSYVHEYLQISFDLNVINICPATKSILWWKSDRMALIGKGTGERDTYSVLPM